MKNWQLSRRALLRGTGIALALPWLDVMSPHKSKATSTYPTRFMTFFVPCGMNMAQWTPVDSGADYTLSPILQPLKDLKDDFLLLSNIANPAALPVAHSGDHSCGTSGMLSLHHPYKTLEADIEGAITIDQVLANDWKGKTRFASLELATRDDSLLNGDIGWNNTYVKHLSWAGPCQPLPLEVNARNAFDRLFNVTGDSSQRLPGKSVLDYLQASSTKLRGRLGTTDQKKLDEYFTSVREVEVRVTGVPSAGIDSPYSDDHNDLPTQIKSMLDVITLAFQTDSTRVITYMFGAGASESIYPFLGLNDTHHSLSHHGGDAVKLGKLQTINTWEVSQLAYLLTKLKSIQEGDGTLLDHSIILFTSEVGDGDSHDHLHLPVLVAGRAGGQLLPGRHIIYPAYDPSQALGGTNPPATQAMMLAAFMQMLGDPKTQLADQPVTPLGQLGG